MRIEVKQRMDFILGEIKKEQQETLDFLFANKHYDGVDSHDRVKERQEAFREGFHHGVLWHERQNWNSGGAGGEI